jgi:hypothetical protein
VGGQNYVFSFWVANPTANAADELIVNFDGGTVLHLGPNAPVQPYTHYTFNVTASHEEAGIEFHNQQPPDYWHLDDVSLTPA